MVVGMYMWATRPFITGHFDSQWQHKNIKTATEQINIFTSTVLQQNTVTSVIWKPMLQALSVLLIYMSQRSP